ncbi:MAG: zf-HC2 domain-containing protein [Acidimicrobiia bacterium]|nr:zf-HC2 domain-containing protein [Acidimicrobiia bacterium]
MTRLIRRRVPDHLSCRQVAKVLQTHLDGELDDETASAVAEHLEMCRRCGLEAATYIELKEALARRAAPVPTASLERLRSFVAELDAHGAE